MILADLISYWLFVQMFINQNIQKNITPNYNRFNMTLVDVTTITFFSIYRSMIRQLLNLRQPL